MNSIIRTCWGPPAAVMASGVLAVFCFPSFNQGWLAWVVFVPLLWGSGRLSARSVWVWGGLAGWAFHAGTLYWVYPTCRWGGVHPAGALAAVFLLSLYMASYWALFGWACQRIWATPRYYTPFLTAAVWTGLELVRSHLFTGFPWLTLAVSQWREPAALSPAVWGGGYAVSFFVMLGNGVAALGLCVPGSRRRRAWGSLGPAAGALLAGLWFSGRLADRPALAAGEPFSVAVIQGNIDQYKKWDAAYERDIVQTYENLTRSAVVPNPPDLIVWPETAVPGWVPNNVQYTRWVAGLAEETGVFLLVGAVSRQGSGDHNGAFLFSPSGTLAGQYFKQHLVPFGEYVPAKRLLGKMVSVLNALGGFDPGPSASLLRGPALLGTNICYEGIFPHVVRRFLVNGAEVLVNITNDGWYRDTAAPEQHLAANVLRAVECGRWLVRAANTGISAIVDPRGRLVHGSALLQPAVVRGDVAPLGGLTPYARYGDWFAGLCLILSGGFFVFSGFRANERKD